MTVIEKTTNLEQTKKLAYKLGQNASSGDIFAFFGDLGSGKTVMAKEIARALKIDDDITSPTYTLMEEYSGKYKFYHFDLYRIDSEAELQMLGFEEYWESDGVSVIEWAEKIKNILPDNSIRIYIEYVNGSKRRIKIEYSDN